MGRLLVLADNKNLVQNWIPWIESSFQVTQIYRAESLPPMLKTWSPQVVIYAYRRLDPHLLRNLRDCKNEDSFAFVVVGEQYSLKDELLAFECGADHYLLLTSPVESVKVRLQALMKRQVRNLVAPTQFSAAIQLPQPPTDLRYKGLHLLPDQNSVGIGKEFILLPPTQFLILKALVENCGEILSREWLRQNVFRGKSISPRSIDAHMAKLKRKLPMLRRNILSIYGKGYILLSDQTAVA